MSTLRDEFVKETEDAMRQAGIEVWSTSVLPLNEWSPLNTSLGPPTGHIAGEVEMAAAQSAYAVLQLATAHALQWHELDARNQKIVTDYLDSVHAKILARTGKPWEPVGTPLGHLEQSEQALLSSKHSFDARIGMPESNATLFEKLAAPAGSGALDPVNVFTRNKFREMVGLPKLPEGPNRAGDGHGHGFKYPDGSYVQPPLTAANEKPRLFAGPENLPGVTKRDNEYLVSFYAYETVGAAIPHCGAAAKTEDPDLMQALGDGIESGRVVMDGDSIVSVDGKIPTDLTDLARLLDVVKPDFIVEAKDGTAQLEHRVAESQ